MAFLRTRMVGFLAVVGLMVGLEPGQAQQQRPPSTADFAQWEALAFQPRGAAQGPLSPDGRWLAYGINRSNRNNELRIANVSNGETAVAAFGEQPVFSADSKWIAYAIAISEADEAKLRKAKKPLHRKAGLRNLLSGEALRFDATESFGFSGSGARIAMKRYAPEPADADRDSSRKTEESDDAKPGATLVVRDLATGRDTTFGNISEYVWQSAGDLLAMTISAEGKVGNGVQLFDPTSGALRVLDSASATFSGLTWRKDADDLAVLRSKTEPGRDGPTQVVLAWTGLQAGAGQPHLYDPTAPSALAPNRRIVAARQPSWSDDGKRIFVGIADWTEKPQASADGRDDAEDEPAGVDVWHWKDTVVVPRQKSLLSSTRTQSMLAVWHLADSKLVPLATDPLEDVRPIKHRPSTAYVVDRKAYAMDRSIGRIFANIYSVDLATGARTKVKDRIEDEYVQASPGGRYLLYLLDDHYWVFDLTNGTHTNITKSVATSFVDKQSDETVKQKSPFGVAGWAKDDSAVWLYDRFDVWSVAPDGTKASRLTEGAGEQVRHRYARLDPDAEWVDPNGYLSVFAIWTKKSGYARLDAGGPSPKLSRTLWRDKSVNGLAKAKKADTYAYVAQAFDDSPDYFVGDASLAAAKQVSATNPFQTQFAWGRAELVEYKSDRGERMQGVLSYPAGYEPGRKYPMVVYMYERLSDGLHSYVSPSERAPYNASVFTSRGYFFFQPDIVFRPREPGLSVVECVLPAVKAVIAKGQVDPARVGVVGHSWGGFDASFLATHTDVFAAAVAGAPITDLVSNYGNFHWSNGIAETDHIETGQQRMEVPIYEDLQAYIRNSAVFGVGTMKTPLLISVGDGDGTVFWHQGLELYNIARRAGKNVVLVAYAGEDHGLRKKPNQVDYHHRIQEWFDHYLKGEPAVSWITNGQSVLDRERELKKKPVAPVQKTSAP
jgi:dipeptidyl aminopeptidase/acylaminoacyl peptidase